MRKGAARDDVRSARRRGQGGLRPVLRRRLADAGPPEEMRTGGCPTSSAPRWTNISVGNKELKCTGLNECDCGPDGQSVGRLKHLVPNMVPAGGRDDYLTEPHWGPLGLLKTRAEPQDEGSYKITGTKIFISSGDRTVEKHLNLVSPRSARADPSKPCAFVVPKFRVNAGRHAGERNTLRAARSKKRGIQGNSTGDEL